LHPVPGIRISEANNMPVNAGGAFVLCWMTAFRRRNCNFSLQRAVEWSKELQKPLVILEALYCDYRWSSERLHGFILDGMKDSCRHFDETPVLYFLYFPFVEMKKSEGKGLVEKMGSYACVVVADDCPAFFLPRMIEAAARVVTVEFELVDSNGLIPLRAMDRVFSKAFSFRRFVQEHLPEHLEQLPAEDPLGLGPL
jgi:deoxyribodipyrimidine photo-lyase